MSAGLPEMKTKWFHKFVEDLESQWPKGLQGRTYAITGTTSGTGFIAARTVAKMGGKVLLLNRASQRAEKSLEKLQEAVPEGEFVPIECDLQSFASVRKAAQHVREVVSELDCLACNAGVMALPNQATQDGFEVQMQTNHLSHFLLTKELLPLLEAAAERHGEARVIQHSSMARKGSPLKQKYFEKDMSVLGGDEIKMMGLGGPRFARYHQTKLANIVFAHALADKLAESGSKVKSLVCHPGASTTSLADTLANDGAYNSVAMFFSKLILQSAEDGSMGLIKCMVSKTDETGAEIKNGAFYGPVASVLHLSIPTAGPALLIKETYTDAQKELLWKASEAAIEEQFPLGNTTLAQNTLAQNKL